MLNYIRSLDGVRGVAVIIVILFHVGVLDVGWVGVQLFFVLSGYLITRILMNKKSGDAKQFFSEFYLRRSLRIFPLFYAYLVALLLLNVLVGIPSNFKEVFPYLATYTFNFVRVSEAYEFSYFYTHMWSLCVEEQFYLIWPFVVYYLKNSLLRKVTVGLILFSLVSRIFTGGLLQELGFSSYEVGDFVYWLTVNQLDAFMLGALIPVFNLHERSWKTSHLALSLLSIAALAGIFNFISLQNQNIPLSISSLGYELAQIANYQYVWSFLLINAAFGSVILCFVKHQGAKGLWANKLMENKYLVEIGKVSYGMYVFHYGILALFVNYWIDPKDNIFVLLVYLIVVYVVSSFSFWCFESQFLKLKSIVSSKKDRVKLPA